MGILKTYLQQKIAWGIGEHNGNHFLEQEGWGVGKDLKRRGVLWVSNSVEKWGKRPGREFTSR